MKEITKTIILVLAIMVVVDITGFLGWALSGQRPVDNFYVGSMTTYMLRYFIKDEVVVLSPRASFLNSTQKVLASVKPSLEKMIMDAEKDGICFVVTSGYRTYEQQVRLYREAEDKSLVAIPGTSEHELGLAVDLGGCPMANGVRDDSAERVELRKPFGELPEYQWLVAHSGEYGFSQSFENEPWHYKFNK